MQLKQVIMENIYINQENKSQFPLTIQYRIKPHLVENNITLTEKDDEVYNQGHRRT